MRKGGNYLTAKKGRGPRKILTVNAALNVNLFQNIFSKAKYSPSYYTISCLKYLFLVFLREKNRCLYIHFRSKLIESRESSNYHRCGRTDRGVSSYGQVISIDLRTNFCEGIGVFSPEDYQGDNKNVKVSLCHVFSVTKNFLLIMKTIGFYGIVII